MAVELALADFSFQRLGTSGFQLSAQALIFDLRQLESIRHALRQSLPVVHLFAQGGQLFHDRLGMLGIVPQVRVFRLFLQF